MYVAAPVMSQSKPLTLEEVIKSAESHYPAAKQKQLIEAAGHENQKLLDASLYPQVSATGQAAYQSEVTSFEMPGLAKEIGQKPDNYSIGLEMRFPLTSFSAVHTRKELEQAQTEVSLAQVDAEMHKLRERVTSLFGNALLQKENQRILLIRVQELEQQRKKIAAGVANGAILKSNQLVFDSEILSTNQRIDDTRSTLQGLINQLSLLTGLALDTSVQLKLPAVELNKQIDRPELKALQAQKTVLDLQSDLVRKENRPNVYLFGQGYYGRPGYNFLNTELRPYGIGGIGLSWNLNNLFNQSRQQKLLHINKDIVSQQEETFRLNLQTSLAQQQAEIDKYENIISKDAQIVQARQEIIRAAASQLENGVITSTEYLTELNAQNTAQLNLVLHQVQQSMAKAQYNILSGY
jgi:outer membrane protein TolC